MQELGKIWMNGELVDWADAKIHVGSHGLHYGSGVFEGIRAYETEKGSAVFRLTDHLERLHNSAKLLYMDLPYSVAELKSACFELIGADYLESHERQRSPSFDACLAPVWCRRRDCPRTATVPRTVVGTGTGPEMKGPVTS